MTDVDVWWATPELAREPSDPVELLDPRECERHARFHFQADRDRYAVAHALARLAVARAAACAPDEVEFALHCRACATNPDGPTRHEPHGKPTPVGAASGVELSISHSGAWVVVATAHNAPVGVDVEAVTAGRDTDGLAEYALTAAERRALDTAPPEDRTAGFFAYWARKEALLKATGDGLSAGLTAVEVSGPTEPAAVLSWDHPHAPEHVHLADLDAGPGYHAALATLAPGRVTVATHDATSLVRTAHARRY